MSLEDLNRGRPSASESVFECLAGFELRRARGGNLDRLPCFGIATGAGLAVRDGERSEAGDVDLFSIFQGLGHVVQHKIEKLFRARTRQIRLPGNSLDEV